MATNPDGGQTRAIRSQRRKVRQVEACRLRVEEGLSYAEIAKRLGVSASQAYQDVLDAIQSSVRESGESAREMELQRLDLALKPVMANILSGKTGDVPNLLRLMERRARYQPTEIEAVDPNVAAANSLLANLADRLGLDQDSDPVEAAGDEG